MTSSGGRLTLDTSAYAHFRRNHAGVVSRIESASEVSLPAVVVGELLGGFALGSHRRENETTLEAFLAEDFVRVLEVTLETARVYGELFASLRRKGTPVPTNDLWIAAATLSEGATLLTFDADFERIGELKLERLR